MEFLLTNKEIKIALSWWETLLSFRHRIIIPLDHIKEVSIKKPLTKLMIRLPGTYLPGVIKAGTYYGQKQKEFWCVTHKNILTLELQNNQYNRVVLSCHKNKIWKQRILSSLPRTTK